MKNKEKKYNCEWKYEIKFYSGTKKWLSCLYNELQNFWIEKPKLFSVFKSSFKSKSLQYKNNFIYKIVYEPEQIFLQWNGYTFVYMYSNFSIYIHYINIGILFVLNYILVSYTVNGKCKVWIYHRFINSSVFLIHKIWKM